MRAVDWEALGWSLAAGLWLTLLFALPPLLAYILFGWLAAVAAAVAVGAAVTLLVKGGKWKWSELVGYTCIAGLFGGLSISVYQLLLDRIASLAAALIAFSLPLLYFLAVAYWYAIGVLPPMYWGEKE